MKRKAETDAQIAQEVCENHGAAKTLATAIEPLTSIQPRMEILLPN
jgi:hypothetical protein